MTAKEAFRHCSEAFHHSSSQSPESVLEEVLGRVDDRSLAGLGYELARDLSLARWFIEEIGKRRDPRGATVITHFALADITENPRWNSPVPSDERELPKAAITALTKVGSQEGVSGLVKLLVYQKRASEAVINALTSLGQSRWAELRVLDPRDFYNCLARWVQSPGCPATFMVLRAILDGPSLRKVVEPGDGYYEEVYDLRELHKSVIAILGRWRHAPATGPLREKLICTEPDVRACASSALARLGQARWEELIRGDDRDLDRLAESSGDPEVFGLLTNAVQGRIPCWSYAAHSSVVRALSRTRDPRAVDVLVDLLLNDLAMWDVVHAVDGWWLGTRGGFTDQVTGSVAEALAELGGSRAGEALCQKLASLVSNPLGRDTAGVVAALGRMRERRAVEPLTEALERYWGEPMYLGLAREVIKALGRIGGQRAWEVLASVRRERKVAPYLEEALTTAWRTMPGVPFWKRLFWLL